MSKTLRKITHLEEDLEYGESRETVIHKALEQFFNCNLTNTKETHGKFCSFDYEDLDKQIRIELKSRRVKKNTYPTSVIGFNKITTAKNYDGLYIFVFEYTDGLYFVEYNNDLGELEPRTFYRLNGEIKTNVDIPTQWLKKIEQNVDTLYSC